MKTRSKKRNQLVAGHFLLGLLGTTPILLLSTTAQAFSVPNKQILAESIQQATAQSVDRAVLSRQQLDPYPNSPLALMINRLHGQRCGMQSCDNDVL
jgi:hypothetical protein